MKFLIIHENPPGSRIVEGVGLRHAIVVWDELREADKNLEDAYLCAVVDLSEPCPGLEAATLGPLFVPLAEPYFDAFERGEKTEEFRPYGPRWNEKTCPIGRRVVLSFGYGKARRLSGRIVSFRTDANATARPGWVECYGPAPAVAACIGIEIEPNIADERHGR